MEVRYYICKHCGNIVEKVKDKGVPVICCGEPMQELKAGVTDAAVEKHVPVYTIEGSHVHVVVGETKHPMLEEHFIEWITLNTNQGIYRKQLNPGQEPVADFCLCDGEQNEQVKKKGRKAEPETVTADSAVKKQEEFEAMKKKTRNMLFGLVAVIVAAVAGIAAYKAMH